MQEATVLLLILNGMLLVITRPICHTAMCTNSAILSTRARPLIECSLQEATYLSKGRIVVLPVVPELANSFNWCGSQNLVVSVALSSSPRPSMYCSFPPVQSLSAAYSTGDKFAQVFLCLKVSLILLLLVSMERICEPIRNRIYTIPQSPWIYRRKPHRSFGLRPWDRVVFRNKSLVYV